LLFTPVGFQGKSYCPVELLSTSAAKVKEGMQVNLWIPINGNSTDLEKRHIQFEEQRER